jgi:hypothetical protein
MAERKEEGKSGKVVERTILDDLGCAFEEEGLVWRHLVEDDLDERRRIRGRSYGEVECWTCTPIGETARTREQA